MMIPRLGLNETRESLREYIEAYSKQSSPNGTLPDYILDQEVDAAILIIKSIWLIVAVFAYVNFAADISLLVGVYKRIRMCLIPWLILAVKNVIFSLISVIIWILYIPIFLFGEHSHSINLASDFYVLFGYSFFLICNSYFWIYTALTVFTHYRELSYHETHLAKNFQKL